MAQFLLQERVFFDRSKFIAAEEAFLTNISGGKIDLPKAAAPSASAAGDQKSVSVQDLSQAKLQELIDARVEVVIQQRMEGVMTAVNMLTAQVEKLVSGGSGKSDAPAKPAAPTAKAAVEDDDDEEIDLFGSSDEEDKVDEQAEKIKQERVAAYAAKKAKKPGPIAKSNIILDVKPWDNETSMRDIEVHVRSVEMDGLVWGASKLIEIGYGIMKLRITCVVEDEKVSVDDIQEKIESNEDLVQSTDIFAFNKV